MVTAICEKTGLLFEAATKRTKNHPTISALMSEANRYGWYKECMEALTAYKGRLGTIEEYVELLETVKSAHDAAKAAEWKEEYTKKQEQDHLRRERAAQDFAISQAGYRIQGGYYDASPDDEVGTYGTYYLSPDGRHVSRKQALREITGKVG